MNPLIILLQSPCMIYDPICSIQTNMIMRWNIGTNSFCFWNGQKYSVFFISKQSYNSWILHASQNYAVIITLNALTVLHTTIVTTLNPDTLYNSAPQNFRWILRSYLKSLFETASPQNISYWLTNNELYSRNRYINLGSLLVISYYFYVMFRQLL